MDAKHWTGDDERELSGDPKSVASLFWRAFDYAARHGELCQFLVLYDSKPAFADLMCQARTRLRQQGRQRGVA